MHVTATNRHYVKSSLSSKALGCLTWFQKIEFGRKRQQHLFQQRFVHTLISISHCLLGVNWRFPSYVATHYFAKFRSFNLLKNVPKNLGLLTVSVFMNIAKNIYLNTLAYVSRKHFFKKHKFYFIFQSEYFFWNQDWDKENIFWRFTLDYHAMLFSILPYKGTIQFFRQSIMKCEHNSTP